MSHYVCQRCKLPLILDDSLEGLSNAQAHLLTVSYGSRPNTTSSTSLITGTLNTVPSISDPYSNERKLKIGEMPAIPEERLKLFEEAYNHKNGKHHLPLQETTKNMEFEGEGSFVILDNREKQDIINKGPSSAIGPSHSELDLPRGGRFNDQPHSHLNASEKPSLGDTVDSLTKIFNILCSKYEIDYPVCSDCAGTLIDELKLKFEQLSKEKDTYVQFLKKLTVQSGSNVDKATGSLQEIDKLKEEEAQLLEELSQYERENESLSNTLYETEREFEKLKIEEQKYASTKNQYELELSEYLNEKERLKALYEHSLTQLDTLRKANVYNDTFLISHDGQFGTINGLRLGMLDSVKVSWHEINAALGQFILLLSTVLSRLNFTLDGYKLIPLGSNSKIEKYEVDPADHSKVKKTVYNCWSNGEMSLASFFSHNKLDSGMVALVEVVSEIGKKLKKLDSSNDLPYQMAKDKVAGYSIRPSARGTNEEWTAACRYLLTNAKWILAYCSVHSPV